MPFCFSLAWLDSILRWCVQFQAQMNLAAQAHLRKDVSRDWSTGGKPGGRAVASSERQQFVPGGLRQTSLKILIKRTWFSKEREEERIPGIVWVCVVVSHRRLQPSRMGPRSSDQMPGRKDAPCFSYLKMLMKQVEQSLTTSPGLVIFLINNYIKKTVRVSQPIFF